MKVLTDSAVRADSRALDQAWDADESFIFVPERGGVSLEWIQSALDAAPADLEKGHFALLTSGSTGQPKLVFGTKARAEKLASVLHDVQDGEPVETAILALPLTYCYSFVNQWLWAKVHHRALARTDGFVWPAELSKQLRESRAAMLCMVGIQVPLLMRNFKDKVFPGVIRLHFAGGRFPQEQLPTLHEYFPNARIYNNYGCAEAMPRLTVRKAEDADASADVGWPLPGVSLSTNATDELLFRSPYGAVAYIDSEGYHPIAETDWVSTGDLARPGEDGRWIITGRSGEVFKRHGEKVAVPLVLATVLEQWKGQAVSYREADEQGEDGHVLVLSPRPSDEEVAAILFALRGKHPRAHWPLRIESLDPLPLLSNGKADVRAVQLSPDRESHWRQSI